MAFAICFCRVLAVLISPTRTRELNGHHQQSPMRVEGIHTAGYCPKVSFATLISPPQCHAAFGTMSHTLASVDQSPVRRPRTLVPSATRTPRVGF
jgi:hypothetical protein